MMLRRRRREFDPVRPLIAGLMLLGFGAWFLLDEAGIRVPGVDRLWPMFVIGGGLVSLAAWVAGGFARPKRAFFGVAAVLNGLFLLAFTIGPLDWDRMNVWWPVFPLIGGIALAVRFVAGGGREPRQLTAAFSAAVVGIVGLALTLTPLGSVLGVLGWPVILIAVGALLIFRAVLGVLVRPLAGFASRH